MNKTPAATNESLGFSVGTGAPDQVRGSDRRILRRRCILCAVFLLLTLLFRFLLLRGLIPEKPYLAFSVEMSTLLSLLTGWIPFSLTEFLLYAAVIGSIVAIVRLIVRMVRQPKRRGVLLARFFTFFLTLILAGVFFFQLIWSGHYHTAKLADRIGLPSSGHTSEELFQASYYTLMQANRCARDTFRTENGTFRGDTFKSTSRRLSEAYASLGNEIPSLKASAYVRPKPVLASRTMSSFGITGVYFGLTGESNVNTDYTQALIPVTAAHEMAHRLCVPREDEANFTAFLACTRSGDNDLRYSGYLHAYIHLINSLYSVDPETGYALRLLENDAVRADLLDLYDYAMRTQGTRSEIGEKVNDTYLRANGQTDGVQSYGRTVDLIISYYYAGGENGAWPQ